MDLDRLYGGSYINWEGVAGSWTKRTVASRLLLFAARRYLEGAKYPVREDRTELLSGGLPEEITRAFASPPERAEDEKWGAFLDAALAAEFELLPYGERPPVISELRAGLSEAAREAGEDTEFGRWFAARKDALPGSDLPDGSGYLPV
ncbi:MAG: hypothetical protein ACR2KW_05150 [Rubrobacter sp.]